MKATELSLPGLILVEVPRYGDSRGHFEELYRSDKYAQIGLPEEYVQDNLSFSKRGVIRGLHYQRPPHGQGKLVRVLSGLVRDVVVDVRAGSATYGQNVVVELSDENGLMLYVPEGFAHGFEALADTVFLYKCTRLYSPTSEGGILYNDPSLGIEWTVSNPIVSDKDLQLPRFNPGA